MAISFTEQTGTANPFTGIGVGTSYPTRHLRILTATATWTSSSGKKTAPFITMRIRARFRLLTYTAAPRHHQPVHRHPCGVLLYPDICGY